MLVVGASSWPRLRGSRLRRRASTIAPIPSDVGHPHPEDAARSNVSRRQERIGNTGSAVIGEGCMVMCTSLPIGTVRGGSPSAHQSGNGRVQILDPIRAASVALMPPEHSAVYTQLLAYGPSLLRMEYIKHRITNYC